MADRHWRESARSRDSKLRRSRSPHRYHEKHKSTKEDKSLRDARLPANLPSGARPLTKHDLRDHRALFGLYLDIQKQINIDDLSEDEVKGRWKSFIGKWNRGDLAEGWYDPVTAQKAKETTSGSYLEQDPAPISQRNDMAGDSDESDDYGPAPAPRELGRVGPSIPRLDDLQHRDEVLLDNEAEQREAARYARKLDRKEQKERLEDLAPRAEPGTRERQLEKKREVAAANRGFREAKSPGAEEVGERDLLGGDDGEGIKAHMKEMKRKKTEKQLRKEEALRAREAEREERMAVHREKESKTMEMLKAIAKQRFG